MMKGCNETSQIVIVAYPILLSYFVELNSEGYFLSGHPAGSLVMTVQTVHLILEWALAHEVV
jgi:hypothetical protein